MKCMTDLEERPNPNSESKRFALELILLNLTSLAQRISLTQPGFQGDRAKDPPQKIVKDPRVLTELGHSSTQAGAR